MFKTKNNLRRNAKHKQQKSTKKSYPYEEDYNEVILNDLIKEDNENKVDLVEFINSEIKKRSIKGSVKYYEDKSDKLLVEYYNIKYIVEIDKICKN